MSKNCVFEMFFLENILKHVMFYDTQGRNAPYILFY